MDVSMGVSVYWPLSVLCVFVCVYVCVCVCVCVYVHFQIRAKNHIMYQISLCITLYIRGWTEFEKRGGGGQAMWEGSSENRGVISSVFKDW